MNKASKYTVSMTCTLLLMNLHNARCRKIISRVDAQSLFVVPRTAQPKTPNKVFDPIRIVTRN